MNPLLKLADYGQSVWLDNISRGILKNNELKKLVEEDGLKGVTSNPTIFQKAIGSGSDYDAQLKEILMNDNHLSSRELFETLAVQDIRDAADVLSGVYKNSGGVDGYVSIEVSPDSAYDTKTTIDEAARLASRTAKPNVMVKIPATQEGIPAIKEMTSRGVNINVTLIFSPAVYEQVVEAYISGLEERAENGMDLSKVTSVASFFVSRIDTLVDKELEKLGRKDLQGKAAIANAKLVYKRAKEIFGSSRFKKLEQKGAKIQRLLWASTSTKNPDYPDTIYIDELIGKDTINTMPPATIKSFKDHGKLSNAIEADVDKAEAHMKQLKEIGIDFTAVTDKLTADGVKSFADSFRDLLKTIDDKKKSILGELVFDLKLNLSPAVNENITRRLITWGNESLAARLWSKDYTIWKQKKEEDKELSNRLGWLEMPYVMQSSLKTLKEFSDEIRKEFTEIILLGMGGSSLAPEVLFKTFGKKEGYPSLKILDSTHPEAVKRVVSSQNLDKTLFIVASKSGGTTETSSFMYTAFDAVSKISKNPGNNFVAVTDPSTILESYAKEHSFRKIFHTPAEVGGRYSALTYFGLLPAALIGVDIDILLNRAFQIMNESKDDKLIRTNGGFKLGAALGELALAGNDKLLFTASEQISSFPSWIEQLIAESTGKEGKGILPVIEEIIFAPELYRSDSILVYIRLLNKDNSQDDIKVEDISASGVPVITIDLEDEYALGREFYRWEIATALAGSVLGINPFDQPDVQSAKTLASEAISSYKKSGTLPSDKPSLTENGIEVYSTISGDNIDAVLNKFLQDLKDTSYVGLLAFLDPSEKADKELLAFKNAVKNKFNTIVTSGFGPRFLHSTGQLHKGGPNSGYFIQLTSSIKNDLNVPGQGYSFGTLITAQAQGDLKALNNAGRKTIRFNFNNPSEGLKYLTKLLEQ